MRSLPLDNFKTYDDDEMTTWSGRDHEGVRRGAALAQGLQDQAAAEGGTSGEWRDTPAEFWF